MDVDDYHMDWRGRLRDELIPYSAYYLTGLVWLWSLGSIQAWLQGMGFAMLAATMVVGIPLTVLVSLMMIWRMFMFGIDSNSIVAMVVAVGGAAALLAISLSAAFPALALGRAVGAAELRAVDAIEGLFTERKCAL